MKIIEPGIRFGGVWWAGRTLACGRCDCRFTLDAADSVRKVDAREGEFAREGEYAEIACPNCGRTVTFYPLPSFEEGD